MTAIEQAIAASVGAMPGMEIGGLLFGHVVEESSAVIIEVEGHRVLPSTRPPGQAYGLPADALANAPRSRADGQQPYVVGYFRTQNHSGIALRPQESALTSQFPDPNTVFLLIEVAAGRPVRAGILHWEPTGFGRTPVLFDVGEAARTKNTTTSGAAAGYQTHEGAGLAQPGPRRITFKTAIIAIVASSFVAGAVGAFWFSRRAAAPNAGIAVAPLPSSAVPSSPLQLMVSRSGDGVLLTWNTHAAPNAQSGQVVITDGDRPPQAVFLGADELRNGKIFYRVQSARLRFRVDLIDGGNKQLSDSVLVLGEPEPAAQPERDRTGAAAAKLARSGVSIPPAATPARTEPSTGPQPSPASTAASNVSKPAAPKFVPPPLRQSATPTERTVRLELPQRIALGVPGPAVASVQIGAPTLPPPPPDASAGGAQPVAAAAKPAYTPPVALSQVVPRVDGTVRALIVREVQVDTVLHIDENGVVTRATVMNPGSGFRSHLDEAAVAAAMRWRFRPAQMNGRNVASVQTVKFVFRR
jgi:TonB family protein